MTGFSAANDRAVALDQKIMGDAGKISSNYVDLVSLATRQTMAAMEAVNASGEAYLSHTTVEGRAAIRLAVGSWRTTRADVDRTWRALQEAAVRG